MREEILADGIRLICGDCREILPTLGKVDAVVTDPPYGISYKTNYRKVMDTPEMLQGDAENAHLWFLAPSARLLEDGGAIVLMFTL